MATTTCNENSISIKTEHEQPDPDPFPEATVFVVFTSINWTMKALEKAHEIAWPVGAAVAVVAVQVVPFPLPLDAPPVPLEFVVRRFEEMAGAFQEKVQVACYLCRNPMEAFKRILSRNCPVVIGVRKGWIPRRDERLARKLRRAGYDMVLVKME
jgi:hypothetical protein